MIRKNSDGFGSFDCYDEYDDETLSVSADFSDYWHDEIDRLVRYVAEYCADETAKRGASLWVWEYEAVVNVGDPGGALRVINLDEYIEQWGREPFRRYLNGEKNALDLLAINILLAIDDIFEDLGPAA